MNVDNLARAAFSILFSISLTAVSAAESPEPIPPADPDGQPLNLDFEQGTLEDWEATGKAFDQQPVKGDTVANRRGDMQSQHRGQYWVGTYERHGDQPQGTLTSVPFKVTQPYAAFRIAGGPYTSTRVELVRADNDETFFKISGYQRENLRPVVVDLKPHQDKRIYIRLIDRHSGGWGHINFDDFKFYAQKPEFDNALDPNQKPVNPLPPPDDVEHAGLSPNAAAESISAPEGFAMHVFAAEPDVQQPIAFTLDARGRLWVAEAYNYPQRAPEGEGRDRILIFEDTDGDHKFDKRKVFKDNLNLVSGLEVGFGGVWVGAAPYLMFIPDRNHDDKPDGEPEILLDGWAWQDTHETLNTFTWGPDGWLYGCHGVFTHSNVGKPGTPEDERTRINAGIWRYHPTRHEFEVFAEGTSNPWGIDFDQHGQCFIEACVIPHLYHVVQGARYQRQAGQHFNPYTYDDIKTIGDHVHWAGNKGPHAANNRSDAAGGGHAHAGMLVYQGNSWPEKYRGQLFMNNIHGQRLNRDSVERQGSGFIGRHQPDFVNFRDRWSQVLNLRTDQNGSVYLIDWYDQNQCHHRDPEGHDRSNGRIFKLVYQDEEWNGVNLRDKSNHELVKLQLHPNIWQVRTARRILQERAHANGPDPEVHQALLDILNNPTQVTHRLRAMWALQVTEGLSDEIALSQLKADNEYIRSWAIQFLAEDESPSESALDAFARLAKEDPSPVVRLYLASALQRTPVSKRAEVLKGLLAHEEDAEDHNLPLMYWYAAEPVVGQSAQTGVALMGQTKIPRLRQYIARRMAASGQ